MKNASFDETILKTLAKADTFNPVFHLNLARIKMNEAPTFEQVRWLVNLCVADFSSLLDDEFYTLVNKEEERLNNVHNLAPDIRAYELTFFKYTELIKFVKTKMARRTVLKLGTKTPEALVEEVIDIFEFTGDIAFIEYLIQRALKRRDIMFRKAQEGTLKRGEVKFGPPKELQESNEEKEVEEGDKL